MKQVYVRIEADETDQGARVARYFVERVQDRLRHDRHVAQRMSIDRTVEHKQVGGRLGRSDHVLDRCDVLDGRVRQFGLGKWKVQKVASVLVDQKIVRQIV